MHPQLWTLPIVGLPIYAYGFLVMLGFLVAIFVTSQRAKKLGLKPEIILDLGIITMIAGIIGARLVYIIIFWDQFKHSWKIFNIFDGNLNIYGGIVGWFIPYVIFQLKVWSRKRVEKWPKEKTSLDQPQSTSFFKTFIWLILTSIISGVIVARVVYLILHRVEYDFSLFQVWKGGLIFYGGFILAILAGWYYLKKKRLKFGEIADLVAPSVVLGVVLGRIGCFLNGCCYGKIATEYKLAVVFPKIFSPNTENIIGSPAFRDHLTKNLITSYASYSLPVHPTQIYEAILCLVLFIVLSLIWIYRKKQGIVLCLMVLFYSLGRFFIEFFRGDKGSIVYGLTDSQLISLGLVFFSLIYLSYILVYKKATKV